MSASNGMNVSVDWKDAKYDGVFEMELRGLARRRAVDPRCKVEDIEGVLQHLYIMDCGQSDVLEITMAATIAAYEHFIAAWKAERS